MNTTDRAMALHSGGCMCGAVRYEIRGAVRSSGICHCQSCRRAASAPAMAWVTVRASDFVVLAGELQRFQSSVGVQRSFCPRCGSPLTYRRNGDLDVDVTTVSLDDPGQFPPTHEAWLDDKLHWSVVNPALAHFARGTPPHA